MVSFWCRKQQFQKRFAWGDRGPCGRSIGHDRFAFGRERPVPYLRKTLTNQDKTRPGSVN